MEEGAIANAVVRAAHMLLDDDPKILTDPFALDFSGVESAAALRTKMDALVEEIARRTTPDFAQALSLQFRAFMTMRGRYTEDELGKALQRGVSQYVILGAGLDSFAHRRRDLARRLHVFEVDHPATQQWKQARLRTLTLESPPNLTLIPLDFEKKSLAESLHAGGYRADVPAFFSWLGVTMYLTEAAIFTTLQTVASAAPGSEILFDYPLPEAFVDEENKQFLVALKAFGAASGELWVSCFEPENLVAQVKALGFTEVWNVNPEKAFAPYVEGRTDGLRPLRLSHLIQARVGSVA